MKFMIEYTVRTSGLAYEDNIANQEALLTAFAKWQPDEGLKVHAFLGRVAGPSGYVLVEADDAKAVYAFASKFSFWNDIEAIPVMDIGDVVSEAHASLAWAKSASKP